MNLLIDIGNSHIKWRTCFGVIESEIASFPYHKSSLIDELSKQLNFTRSRTTGIYVSNVAGSEIESAVSRWFINHFDIMPNFAVSSKEKCGLISAYNQPRQLGVDRFLAMIGARLLVEQAMVVVDCGTATTVDSVTQDGKFIGGIILPGVSLMRKSLSVGTDALELIDDVRNINVHSIDTKGGIAAGTLLATVGAINMAVNRLSEISGHEVKCVITGGDGFSLLPHLQAQAEYHPDLVLKGLMAYFRVK